MNILKIFLLLSILIIVGCTTFSSKLHTEEEINRDTLKRGQACVHNLFGGFKIPYFGDSAIRLRGSQSIIVAINNGKIKKPAVIDTSKKHYVFYSKLCTIIYGE